jgi:uncharacterized membrane protein YphA (DoxX/SURF4 family)
VVAAERLLTDCDGLAEANQANFYKNLAIMAAYLLLAITGAGRYSLDHRGASAPSQAAAASA